MSNPTRRFARTLLTIGAIAAPACSHDATPLDSQAEPLVAECIGPADMAMLPSDAWVCPAPRRVECSGGSGTLTGGTLYVADPGDNACGAGAVVLSNSGPFGVGQHTISVSLGPTTLCTTELTVVDSAPPQAQPHTLQLWPPNHKFHTISVSDCVGFEDACGGHIDGEFVWASSDEPVDDKGDGHHAPDIELTDCGHIAVRAERAGPRNGRVYTLGVRVVDAGGNTTEAQCRVIVDHDQRGVQGADDGEAYRLVFDGSQGGPACDGKSEPPPAPPGTGNPPPDAGQPPTHSPPADAGAQSTPF